MSNELKARLCANCKMPLVKRYLWSCKELTSSELEQVKVNGRYLSFGKQIFLDTEPGTTPLDS